ncbi:MAG: rhodanese-like domain-containing protein, partial [Phaeodactylibacter sp.]|nr:rhodanese-like domain-containing protein [Phaeodactylibacter sp.]
ATGAIMLDTRTKEEFVKGFVPNSIFIGLDGSFAPWVGALIPDLMHPILVIAEPGREEEVVKRLARVGYDNAIGYLEGGFDNWKNSGKEVDAVETISIKELEQRLPAAEDMKVLDVRKPGEFGAEHIEDALSFPLDYINSNMDRVSKDQKYFVHCRSGYRSTIAASILKARGFEHLVNIHGVFDDVITSSIPTTDFVCASQKQ